MDFSTPWGPREARVYTVKTLPSEQLDVACGLVQPWENKSCALGLWEAPPFYAILMVHCGWKSSSGVVVVVVVVVVMVVVMMVAEVAAAMVVGPHPCHIGSLQPVSLYVTFKLQQLLLFVDKRFRNAHNLHAIPASDIHKKMFGLRAPQVKVLVCV